MRNGCDGAHGRRRVCEAMAVQSPTAEKSTNKRSSKAEETEAESVVRILRLERGLTQEELADQSGMHRNSLGRVERGTTKEVTREKAVALAGALKVPVSRLGLRVRSDVEARSVRFRRLTLEQRHIVDEILSLPPEAYVRLREVIEMLRPKPRTVRSARAKK
jgi:transcriptional regulator with XRE-family HTH domain